MNLIENHADRFQQQSGLWSGTCNEAEARVWQQMITEQGFAEWKQDQIACEIGMVLSRLDRVHSKCSITGSFGFVSAPLFILRGTPAGKNTAGQAQASTCECHQPPRV